jgi:uncharacterized protein YggT (Ycf19 family)
LSIENVEALQFLREQYRIKGKGNLLLVWRILQTVKGYSVLTVRQLFYILVSRFPKDYPATRAFYKRMNRYLCKIRRVNADVNRKFIDPTRRFIVPPLPYPRIEIWVEKDSIRNFIAKLAAKYRLGIQVLRGFASLSMYRKALERARKRGVTRVLYIGDFDPSGLLIETVAQEEMDHRKGINFVRLALTMEQIKRFKPPSRPVNLKDTRAKEYIQKYGDRCWEVEAIRPRTLYHLIEVGLKQAVPPEYLAVAEAKEKAARLARPITERLAKAIEEEVFHMLAEGVAEEEILSKISQKYGIKLRSKKVNRGSSSN